MKFKVHTYDSMPSKSYADRIGRFEIYNEEGEFIAASGKRRVKNFEPRVDAKSVPMDIIIKDMDENTHIIIKKIKGHAPREPRYGRRDITGLDTTVYEVNCVKTN